MRNEQNDGPAADILIVDDNPDSLRLLIHLLSRQGYKVRPVRDGLLALQSARQAPPDLILLDVMMPEMSGYEVCEALKADETTRDIPVIFISALDQVFDKVRAFSVGGVDYVSKPFQNEEILARVKTHLALYQLQTHLRQTNQQLQDEIAERKRVESALWQRNQELLALQATGEVISSRLDIHHVLDTVANALQELLDIQGCSISEWHRERHVVTAIPEQAPTYWINQEASTRDYDLNQYPLTLKVLVEQKPAQVNTGQPEADPAELALIQELGGRALLMVPMISQGETLGLIELLECRTERTFTEAEIALAQLLANQAATAVQNARLYQQAQQEITERKQMGNMLEKHNRALQALYRTTLDIGSKMNMPTLLPSILEHAIELLDADRGGGIYMDDPDKRVLRLTEGLGINQNRIGVVLQHNEGMVGRVFQSAEPLIVNDYTHWEGRATVLVSWPPSAVMGVPLFLEGQVIGVLGVFANSYRRIFSQEDISLAEMFAAQVTVALQNARLYQQAQEEIIVRKRAELLLKETNDSLQQRISELTILHLIAQTLTTVTDVQAALDKVVHIVNVVFNTCGTSVSIFDPASKEIKVFTSYELQGSDFSMNAPANEADSGPDEQVMGAPLNLLRDRLLKEKGLLSTSQVQTSPALISVQRLFQARHIQGLLLVPLQARGEVIGFLTLATDRPEYEFTPAEERLAETIAGQIAAAVKIAHLFEEERRQRQLAESLRQVATVLSSSLERPTILNIIFEQLQQVLQYDGASIGLIEGEELVIVQAVGRSVRYLDYRLPLKSVNALTQVLLQRQVVILTNLAEAESWPTWFRPREPGSWMGAPLGVGRTFFGLLAIEQDQVGAYCQDAAKILQTFANQAAIAIENTRLYTQAQTIAIDAERQRLSREMHDSITQSLYSLTLFANGWAAMAQRRESDVPQIVQQFKQLEEISSQGLKEMRLLLHQLRPPILEEVGLVGALQHRLDTVEHRVNVQTRLLTSGVVDELPLAIEEQLLAVAQEALTNTLRHAEATEVIVLLKREDGGLTLAVTDNGIGFDPSAPSFGLGLASIRERAEAIGGQVEITSAPLQGTTIMVTIALRPEEGV
jgi:GAF domain-containing protein/CheY-like chemotaxis protein